MNEQIPGVKVSVGWHYVPLDLDEMMALPPQALQARIKEIENPDGSLKGGTVKVSADGALTGAEFGEGIALELKLQVAKSADVMVAQIGRPQSKVKDVRVWTPRTGNETTVSYELTVQVKNSSAYGCLVTHHPVNYLAVVALDRNGSFDFSEVAIVSQSGAFFVTIQKKYSGRLYAYKGTAVCPQFANWPELQAALAERHGVKKYDLAAREEYKPVSPFEPHAVSTGQAEVVWYDMAKGLGCLRLPDGTTARAFVGEIDGRPIVRYLTAGEVVTYRELEPLPPGGGKFSFDARGIKISSFTPLV